MSTESSENGKSDSSDSSKNEPLEIDKLEARELAKHHLRYLTESFEEYYSLYDSFLQWHYLIVSVCCVMALLGIIIAILKLMKEEILLDSFILLQSSFASIIPGGGIIALGSKYFFFDKDKDESEDEHKVELKDEVIELCMKGDLGEKLDNTTKELREKKNVLEQMMSLQSRLAMLASIIVLLLIGIDYFRILPDVKYLEVWLGCLLSLTGIYFLCCEYILKSVLSKPREELEKNHLILFLFVIPCAFLGGFLVRDEIRIWTTLYYLLKPHASKNRHWIKEVYLSPDEKTEIVYLLHGLNPDVNVFRVSKFHEELTTTTENTPLLHIEPTENTPLLHIEPTEFDELVNETEFKANQQIFEEYFNLGAALAKCLGGNVPPEHSQRGTEYKETIEKFSFIKSYVERIRKHYLDFDRLGSGLTLVEFFEKYPKLKHENLRPEETNIAHNALKVYCIFSKIGEDKIKHIKKFPVHSIGKFTRNEIFDIVNKIKTNKR